MTLKVALFGAGRIGHVHARSIRAHQGSELVAVSDVVPEAAEALAREYGIRVADRDEILDDAGINAIVICSSTNTHADLIEAGIAAGKAVFCEKPVDLDLGRARSCLVAVEASDVPVMMGFNRRFDPQFAALKAAFDAGEIGKGELLTITSYDPGLPPIGYIKTSGGLFRDMTIHDFDIACWLFGEPPATVFSTGSVLVDSAVGEAGDIDTAVTILGFADGRISVIKNSRRAVHGYDQRLELLGESGMLAVGNVLENTLVKSTEAGVASANPEHFFLERYMRAYEAEWARFVEAVTGGAPVPATVHDGITALRIAEAALESLEQGRMVAL